MASSTPNMGLTTWDPNDYFNDADLKANWEKIDLHDHTGIGAGLGKQISTDALTANAITTEKIADSQVTGSKIKDGSVTKGKLAGDLVTALNDAKNALSTTTDFGYRAVGDTRPLADISGLYDDLKIKDGSITDFKIAPNALIDPSKINIQTSSNQPLGTSTRLLTTESTVLSGDLTGGFGTSSLVIKSGVITNGKIADDAITTSKILDANVTASKLHPGAITISGVFTNRPAAASYSGKQYWSSDTFSLYYSDGSDWHSVGTSTGTVAMFTKVDPPDGWVNCDGSTYSPYVSKYNALFQVIQYTFGGNGMDLFKVPGTHPGSVPVQSGAGYPLGSSVTAHDSASGTAYDKIPVQFMIKL